MLSKTYIVLSGQLCFEIWKFFPFYDNLVCGVDTIPTFLSI